MATGLISLRYSKCFSSLRLRLSFLFGTAICLLLAFLLRIDHAIRPNLCAVCESETKQFTAGLMADSIAEVLQDQQMKNVSFAELTYDAAGNVTTMETRTDQINRLQSAIYRNVQQHLEQCRDAELEVSLGTASGVWIFAGRGPHVSVRLLPVGHASVKLISRHQPNLPHHTSRGNCGSTDSHSFRTDHNKNHLCMSSLGNFNCRNRAGFLHGI